MIPEETLQEIKAALAHNQLGKSSARRLQVYYQKWIDPTWPYMCMCSGVERAKMRSAWLEALKES